MTKLLTENMFAGNGTGSAADWGYCSSSRPCAHREGDCDNDAECAQDHVCGDNNCINYWNLAETEADCCIPGNLIIMTNNKTVHAICCLMNDFWFCWLWFETSEVRLVGGSGPHEGNILVGGLPVCDDHHDAQNAQVVCRFAKNRGTRKL